MAADDVLIERMLRVIDEGRRTATYKLALLLAIIDATASLPDAHEIPTTAIAERVVELYYPQTRPYVDRHGIAHRARQISMKSSTAVTAVEELRTRAELAGLRHLADVRHALPTEVAGAVATVEETFVRYPIPLLQVVGSSVVPFLYEVEWGAGTSLTALRRQGRDRIRLLEGVGDRLVVLGPMLRPLIELHWVRDVARWSEVATEDQRLHDHLFGQPRTSFPRSLVGGLRELQGDECFYCASRLGARPEVDHFLAWSRWPNDAVENLVLADR